jgi:hypothetical protein
MHFAQVNEMDGFFITAHEPDPAFIGDKLEGADAVLFGGGQPLAMFKYACHKADIAYGKINAINPGGPREIYQAFRDGQGRETVFSKYRRGGTGQLHLYLSATWLLDPTCGNHRGGLSSDLRHLRV